VVGGRLSERGAPEQKPGTTTADQHHDQKPGPSTAGFGVAAIGRCARRAAGIRGALSVLLHVEVSTIAYANGFACGHRQWIPFVYEVQMIAARVGNRSPRGDGEMPTNGIVFATAPMAGCAPQSSCTGSAADRVRCRTRRPL
jgi:hypothetical protein